MSGRRPASLIPAGPLESEPIEAAIARSPGPTAPRGALQDVARSILGEALDGIPLGAYDRRIVEWLSGWDLVTVLTVASLIGRARAAGPP